MKADESSDGGDDARPQAPLWGTAERDEGADQGLPAWGTPPPAEQAIKPRWFRRAWIALAAAAAVGAALAIGTVEVVHPESRTVAGTGAAAGDETSSAHTSISGTWVDMENVKAGECIESDQSGVEAGTLYVVSCTAPHNEEIVGTPTLEPGRWPGQDAADRATKQACRGRFKDYVGVDENASALSLGWYGLDEDTWSNDDRLVICVVDTTSHLTGSVKGSGR